VKTARPDLPAYALCALAVLGIVILSLFRVAVPDVLPLLASGSLVGGAGISLNTPSASDGTAQRIESALASLETLLSAVRRPSSSTPAPAPARPAAPAQGIPMQAAPVAGSTPVGTR